MSNFRFGSTPAVASRSGERRRCAANPAFRAAAANCRVGWRAKLQRIASITTGGVGFNPVSRKTASVQHDGKFFAQNSHL